MFLHGSGIRQVFVTQKTLQSHPRALGSWCVLFSCFCACLIACLTTSSFQNPPKPSKTVDRGDSRVCFQLGPKPCPVESRQKWRFAHSRTFAYTIFLDPAEAGNELEPMMFHLVAECSIKCSVDKNSLCSGEHGLSIWIHIFFQ